VESSASVWGRTFEDTGGGLLFLVSLLAWVGSGALSLQEKELIATLNLVTFLPVAATLIPRIKNKFRGIMILAALILEV